MPKKQRRDKAYYEKRLKDEFPAIYADLEAGKYPTVAAASIAAGLKKQRTRLHELKNAWDKASKSEQHDFLSWISALGMVSAPTPTASSSTAPILAGRYLLPAEATRIRFIMARRGLSAGDIMGEMGFRKMNPSLGLALGQGYAIKPSVITALASWLAANSAVS